MEFQVKGVLVIWMLLLKITGVREPFLLKKCLESRDLANSEQHSNNNEEGNVLLSELM